MTTREQLKRAVGIDRSDASRGVAADPAPSLPERLYAARERKGVDLYRAERDTKIRARYLGALERGDYKELPGAVYTKGFLRNYALYLGLDPEDVLAQWRHERGDGKEQPPAIVVPRPIAASRKGMTFSPGIVVAALLTVVIVAFGAYLGIQVLRFTKPPTIAVTQPATAVVDVDESTTSYTLEGTTLPGATVSIATPGREPYQVTAKSDGEWAAAVDLRRGRNQFDVTSLDPETGKRSEGVVSVFITVPFLEIEAPKLAVEQPSDGASFENGAIPVAGTATNAATVVVSATYVGPSGPAPGGGKATPAPPPAPPSVTATVAEDGTYSTPYELTAGKWLITVTASGPEGKTRRPDPGRHGRLQGRQPGRDRQGWTGLGQGLGRWQARSGCRGGRSGALERQVPQVHRQGVGRGPDRIVGRHAVHVERHATRCTRSLRRARDVVVRPAQGARKDPAALSRGRRPARRPGRPRRPSRGAAAALEACGSRPSSRARAGWWATSSPRSQVRAPISSAAS